MYGFLIETYSILDANYNFVVGCVRGFYYLAHLFNDLRQKVAN